MSGDSGGEPTERRREPRSAMRLLPWLLIPLVVIPLVLAIIRTRKQSTPMVDTAAPAAPQDSLPTYHADSVSALPADHPARRRHPVAHADSADSAARHKDGLLKRIGKDVDRLGGGNAPVTPDGQGAMGGDGPTGKGERGTDSAPPLRQAPAGAMGGDGPPGKR